MKNYRFLTSRNKREGWYMGRGHYDRKTGGMGRLRHIRVGHQHPAVLSLRDWMRYPWRCTTPIPF